MVALHRSLKLYVARLPPLQRPGDRPHVNVGSFARSSTIKNLWVLDDAEEFEGGLIAEFSLCN